MHEYKMSYEAPALTEYGSVSDLTHGQAAGEFLDATFPTGTPFSEVTFS